MVLWGIINEHVWESALERYRSGHNEAVLKTVCPQGRVGSNPTLSAGENDENQLTKMSKKTWKSVWQTKMNMIKYSS